MPGWERIGWDWEPGVVAGCALLGVFYGWASGWRFRWRAVWFFLGDLVILAALVSPLDTLADHYLFSAHMAQHLLLLEVAPPLLLLGLPADWVARLLRLPWAARWERRLARPLLAWGIGFGTFCLWHWPWLYDAAVRNDGVHALEHICFLASATIFWWPLLAPLPRLRMPIESAIYYLFARMAANLILGTAVALAPLGFYAVYVHPADTLGLLRMIRQQWGLTPLLDQRLGGMLMWAPSVVIDTAAIPLLLALRAGREEAIENNSFAASGRGQQKRTIANLP